MVDVFVRFERSRVDSSGPAEGLDWRSM